MDPYVCGNKAKDEMRMCHAATVKPPRALILVCALQLSKSARLLQWQFVVAVYSIRAFPKEEWSLRTVIYNRSSSNSRETMNTAFLYIQKKSRVRNFL